MNPNIRQHSSGTEHAVTDVVGRGEMSCTASFTLAGAFKKSQRGALDITASGSVAIFTSKVR